MHSALRATVSGRVQMVMFRDFVRRKALALGLIGEVKNMSDGTVAVYAEGPQESLEALAGFLKKGSALSRVENVAYQFVHPEGAHTTFVIAYD